MQKLCAVCAMASNENSYSIFFFLLLLLHAFSALHSDSRIFHRTAYSNGDCCRLDDQQRQHVLVGPFWETSSSYFCLFRIYIVEAGGHKWEKYAILIAEKYLDCTIFVWVKFIWDSWTKSTLHSYVLPVSKGVLRNISHERSGSWGGCVWCSLCCGIRHTTTTKRLQNYLHKHRDEKMARKNVRVHVQCTLCDMTRESKRERERKRDRARRGNSQLNSRRLSPESIHLFILYIFVFYT